MFLAVLVLLNGFQLLSGFPADLKCLGKRLRGQIFFELTPDITEEIHNCDSQWLVNEKVAAICDGSGNAKFEFPVLNVTASSIIMHVGFDEVNYTLICPLINVDKRLRCSSDSSSRNPVTLAPLPGNETSVEEGFPVWQIAVIVMGTVVLSGVIIFICIKVKKIKKSKYALASV